MEVLGGGSSVLNDTALHLGQALLNVTAKQPQQQQDILYITDNRVTDSQLTTSLWLNALLGFIFFCLFCILQRTVFPQHYRFRLVGAGGSHLRGNPAQHEVSLGVAAACCVGMRSTRSHSAL